MVREPRLLFVDAYDSFSANIVALLRKLHCANVTTIKIDADFNEHDKETLVLFLQDFDAIVLGPGPGNPASPSDTGLFDSIWKHAAQAQVPVLGICLGFQSLCVKFGLPVSRLDVPCHGHAKTIHHYNDDIFESSGRIIATCYNSLGVQMDTPDMTPDISRPASSASNRSYESSSSVGLIPDGTVAHAERDARIYERPDSPLRVLAYDDAGYVMAIRHQSFPFWGFQFHPESCKSNAASNGLLTAWWARVQIHNSKHRSGHSPQLRPVSESQHQLDIAQVSWPLSSLPVVDILQSLTASIDQTTHYKTLPIVFDRQKLADLCYDLSPGGSVAMLESTKRGRFSIFGLPHESTWHLTFQKGRLCVSRHQEIIQHQELFLQDAMQLIEAFLSSMLVTEGDRGIPFWGGFTGFYSYEVGLDLLEVSTADADAHASRTVTEISLMWVDRSIVVDHQEQTMTVQTIRQGDEKWLEQMVSNINILSEGHTSKQGTDTVRRPSLIPSEPSLPSHDEYISQIRSCQSALHAGDSYELCLTTSATVSSQKQPYTLYTSLQQTNPAPYAAYLHLLNTHVISSSPEQFLSWSRNDPYLDMKPMKGTLPKSRTINTIQKAREILLNPKEEAENLMIADLIRHDLHSALGPDCHVTVEKLFEVVETESLYQLISHIRGQIPIPAEATERARRLQIMTAGHRALRTALPAASMTGAPKKRSCEILRSLERRNRGVYSGVIGYFDVGGGGEWSVGIRCAFSHDSEDPGEEDVSSKEDQLGVNAAGEKQKSEALGDVGRLIKKWWVGAGGAITVLSDEEAEWEEMRAKMDCVLRGFGVG